MIKSTYSNNVKPNKRPFPKLMRGINTGAIYLAHKFNAWPQTIESTVLHPGKDLSAKVGDKHNYDAFLFEEFDGSVTLTNLKDNK